MSWSCGGGYVARNVRRRGQYVRHADKVMRNAKGTREEQREHNEEGAEGEKRPEHAMA